MVVVVASDNGNPRLSSSATIRITVQDVNDNEPVFEKTFYNVSLKENESDNLCFLKVVATDPDCGVNSQVGITVPDWGVSYRSNLWNDNLTFFTANICQQ